MKLLSPAGISAITDVSYGARAALDPGDRVGLLANSFPGSVDFIRAVGTELEKRQGRRDFVFREKGGIRESTLTLSVGAVDTLADRCDVVFAAYGHCGSCSSAIVRDVIALAQRGVRVCAFVTDEFADTALFVARSAGMSDVPIVWLPHPMAARSAAERADIASRVADSALAAIEGVRDVAVA